MGGSPFSHSVQNMGYGATSQSGGFAKKAMMAAGVGAVAGMAMGYGLGRFPRPSFNYRNAEEEQHYNNYMYRKYGTKSTDSQDYGRDYAYKMPPDAQSYDSFMVTCMKRTDLLRDTNNKAPDKPLDTAPPPNITDVSGTGDRAEEEEMVEEVSLEEIGYPALIDQVKSRRCVEEYMKYSEQFLKKTAEAQRSFPDNKAPQSLGGGQLYASLLMLLASVFLLH